jgi:hypothetical protein
VFFTLIQLQTNDWQSPLYRPLFSPACIQAIRQSGLVALSFGDRNSEPDSVELQRRFGSEIFVALLAVLVCGNPASSYPAYFIGLASNVKRV